MCITTAAKLKNNILQVTFLLENVLNLILLGDIDWSSKLPEITYSFGLRWSHNTALISRCYSSSCFPLLWEEEQGLFFPLLEGASAPDLFFWHDISVSTSSTSIISTQFLKQQTLYEFNSST